MKTLTIMTAVATIVAGVSIASAQTNDGKTTAPGSINAAPTQEGNMGKSGAQPKGTADMPAGTAPRATTGTSADQPTANPSSPSAKPNDNAGGTGK